MAKDGMDKVVVFLAKRDGIDKLVKTFQYVSKLLVWRVEASHPGLARRARQLESATGLSRKAFRTGRFLSGLNALRRSPGGTPALRLFSILANAGEMVYFLFDHLLFLSRIGTLDANAARRLSFVSAFGESVGYVFFITLDLIAIREGFARSALKGGRDGGAEERVRAERAMRAAAVAANVADLIIAAAEVEPNRFCNHAVSLGVSGLVSAWAGWYRNWPS